MNKTQARQDGRQAYENLRIRPSLLSQFAAIQVFEARRTLQTLAFHGEPESGDFDKFVTLPM